MPSHQYSEVILLQKMKLPTKHIQQSLYPDVLRGNYDTERTGNWVIRVYMQGGIFFA